MLYSLAVLINISEIVLTDCVHPTPTSASELNEMEGLGVSVHQDKYGKLNISRDVIGSHYSQTIKLALPFMPSPFL